MIIVEIVAKAIPLYLGVLTAWSILSQTTIDWSKIAPIGGLLALSSCLVYASIQSLIFIIGG